LQIGKRFLDLFKHRYAHFKVGQFRKIQSSKTDELASHSSHHNEFFTMKAIR
jgi:hypothetical protein